MAEDEDRGGEAPCYAHLFEDGADAAALRDVARWRKAERARLIAARQALPVADRQAADRRLAEELDRRLPESAGAVIALYWPFRGEPDLRGWAAARRDAGARLALPVVVEKAAPLIFRAWEPGMALERGIWNIPVPPADAPELRPDIVIAPVVGLGEGNFRLGYGGGYYDRTLAGLKAAGAAPHVIGVGYGIQVIDTIFPQPFDVPMTEAVIVPV
ncbi:5-formyltetrahydrofolate cyclo-ligase [Maritimibacter sp. 55A14]|uniref:5-formyltetrahydrofolate cyclo-ligase n=1 Tax=Maritimibacter sp. 55A14 TaxID=2174844 RepID=UPI000D60E87A|nr:5-formyltetrahydrofolate cyclo-ligase [Maritimibacter sp. 55A14]PWE33283.1 5-formyltetrahydrofolate cyclo-ligase [Maritimibacter sp. 55A14]